MISSIHSRIYPQLVYTGDISLDPQDYNRPLTKYTQYEIVLQNQTFEIDILIGHKTIHQRDNVCYFYIYSAASKHRLGLFEFTLDSLPQHIDEEGDLIPPPKPLLFPFVTMDLL